jgi:hypothetical protein
VHILILIALVAHSGYQYVRLRAAGRDIEDRARELAVERASQRGEFVRAGRWLHAFYQGEEGLQRPQGLCSGSAGEPDFDGLAAWLFDAYARARISGASEEEARQIVAGQIRQTDEWRAKH